MTVQYEGSELYSIHIGHQKFQLSKDEIEEIQTLNLETMQSYEKSVSELEDKIEEIKNEVSDLDYSIRNMDIILSHEIIDDFEFDNNRDQIQKIIEKLQRI